MRSKILRRDPVKDPPEDFSQCLIFPHRVVAEYQLGFFIGNNDRIMYTGVKTYVYWKDVLEHIEYKEY